jgi:hypothetical protein
MRNQMRLMKRYLMGLVSSKSEGKSGCGMISFSVLMPFTITWWWFDDGTRGERILDRVDENKEIIVFVFLVLDSIPVSEKEWSWKKKIGETAKMIKYHIQSRSTITPKQEPSFICGGGGGVK